MNKQKKLSVTIGITTCYSDESIIETIRSIRRSKVVKDFPIILIADTVPVSSRAKANLEDLHVKLIENRTRGSQLEKQKQILKLTKTDIIIFTQDDVLIDEQAIATTIDRFADHKDTTMISILNKPVKPTNLFESILCVGTELVNKFATYWNGGDNYLSVIGRFMAFRTSVIKNKFRLPKTIVNGDGYYYLENKRVGGKYEYIPQVAVYFKNPQNMKEHIRKSSRFQHSQIETARYFKRVYFEYKVPNAVLLRSVIEQFLSMPILTTLYFFVFLYTRLLKLRSDVILTPIWEVDKSTKQVAQAKK